jgi:hypothetical protein
LGKTGARAEATPYKGQRRRPWRASQAVGAARARGAARPGLDSSPSSSAAGDGDDRRPPRVGDRGRGARDAGLRWAAVGLALVRVEPSGSAEVGRNVLFSFS